MSETQLLDLEQELGLENPVMPYLRQLGFRPYEARRGARACDDMPGAPLEDRVRAALVWLGRARRTAVWPAPGRPAGSAARPAAVSAAGAPA